MKIVLVTGGTGFIGRHLQKLKSEWIYVSSDDYSLTNINETRQMYEDIRPDAVIHLAARVGGIDLFYGPPAKTNFSYGYSKRLLHVLVSSYRKQYKVNYSTFCPSNVYGPGDNFNSEKSHFVASLVSKAASLGTDEDLELWGTGKPLRQQLYVGDLCEIMTILLDKHNSEMPLIVAPNENLSVDTMTRILMSLMNKENKVIYNGLLEGQHRKDGSNKELLNLIGDFKFTSFSEGIMKVINSYNEQRELCKKNQ